MLEDEDYIILLSVRAFAAINLPSSPVSLDRQC